MNRHSSLIWMGALLAITVGLGLTGCRDIQSHSLVWPAGGDLIPSHPEPPEDGYYTDWDPYAKSLEVDPVGGINPIQTQHILIATVRDAEGKPLPNRRVEWMIPDGVGAFVEVDESGWRASRGYKLNNRFVVTHTNPVDRVLTRGNDDPSDDIHLETGQTWAVITSAIEGVTHVVAYAPSIYDWDKHKVFVSKQWRDVAFKLPPVDTNPTGKDHELVTRVMKHSDGEPLVGYEVTYTIRSGPAATFGSDKKTVTVKTDDNGLAKTVLKQVKPTEGVNEIGVEIVKPAHEPCGEEAILLAVGTTTKTWVGPRIGILKNGPPLAVKDEPFEYRITVTNPSRVDTKKVVVTDTLPNGLAFVSAEPKAKQDGKLLTWSIGNLAAGGTSKITLVVKGVKSGKYENCAEVTADQNLKAKDCAITTVTAPALTLSKSAPTEVLLCDEIQYVLKVTNTGDGPATNVRIIDRLADGLTWRDSQKAVSFNVGTLPPGQSRTMRFVAKASKTGKFENTATATADPNLKASAKHAVTVKKPTLKLTNTAPKLRYVGNDVTWSIELRNTGDIDATQTIIVDTLPAGVSFTGASDGGRLTGRNVTWALGTLAPGDSRKVTVSGRADIITKLTNTVTARAVCAEATAEAVTNVKGIPAILLEMIDLEDPILIGGTETYEITIINQGSAVDTNIRLVCTLPDNMEYISSTGPTEPTVKGKKVTFAPLTNLSPKARATYRLTCKANTAGDVRFHVEMTSDQIKSPVEENEATRIYSDKK